METHLLEYRILSFLRNRDAYLKYSPIIKENLLEDRYSKYVYRLLLYYHKHAKGKKRAPLQSLFALVNSRVKETEAPKYRAVIRKIKKFSLTDETIADGIVRRFAKRQLLKLGILEAVNSLNNQDGDVDVISLKNKLDEAVAVESIEVMEDALDYFKNPSKRLTDDANEPRIGTYLHPDLDMSLRGGLAGGEIGLVVAPTKIGKTMFLINIAYNATQIGKKVLYVTLELSGKRIAGRLDQLVTKRPWQYIRDHPQIVFSRIRKLRSKGGGLRIKDSVANKMSPHELSVYLERLRKDFEFDMVIIDQMDLMHSPKEFRERRHELSSILISLRRIGATFGVPIWTASQANRSAGEAGNTTIWNISEDIGKANWADVILTLSQSPEDKEENIIILDVAGNRISDGNPKIMLGVNYPLMRLKGIGLASKDENNVRD